MNNNILCTQKNVTISLKTAGVFYVVSFNHERYGNAETGNKTAKLTHITIRLLQLPHLSGYWSSHANSAKYITDTTL